MLKDNRKTIILTSIVTLLPILAGLCLWKRLPDVMATHFGLNNEANGFSSKAFAVFGLPLILLAVHLFCAFVTSKDPRQGNINPKLFTLVLWICPVVSLFVAAVVYPFNLGLPMDVGLLAGVLLGALFLIVGNYMPKTRQNYTIGIKIPWTLADEDNWNRTHRLAGRLWVAGGILMLLMALTGHAYPALMIALILIIVIAPCVYSYMISRK
jgi:uncharacterized membrane protein